MYSGERERETVEDFEWENTDLNVQQLITSHTYIHGTALLFVLASQYTT